MLGESDFNPVDITVTFPENSTDGARSCFNVIILDDMGFEKTQYFSLMITDFEENVHLLIATFDIHIHDDDRKLSRYITPPWRQVHAWCLVTQVAGGGYKLAHE